MKCRIFMLHKDTNPGKVQKLEALHREYVAYVRICVEQMLDARVYTMPLKQMQRFFPKTQDLTSQIQKNARNHAINVVSTWFKTVYTRKIKPTITNLLLEGDLTDKGAKALYTVGKHLLSQPWGFVTQEHIDAYSMLLEVYGGNKPRIRSKLPMRLSETTASLQNPKKAVLGGFWLASFSTLEPRKTMSLPLAGNPYIQKASQVSKGILVRKTGKGKWRFEAVDKTSWEVQKPSENAQRLGVDIGLNVLAATSSGCWYGEHVKPKFKKLYARLRKIRANRQKQGLRENSPRLDRLESRLSGFVKTETGRVANQIVRQNPDTVFVLEDLDLSGCKGQKRFAYRALQSNLERKAPTQKINPAYTSQECPSCGYVSRRNRSGTKFTCRGCGRKAHADWAGASGILRRSGDKDIGCADRPKEVKRVLSERYRSRRNRREGYSSSGFG